MLTGPTGQINTPINVGYNLSDDSIGGYVVGCWENIKSKMQGTQSLWATDVLMQGYPKRDLQR